MTDQTNTSPNYTAALDHARLAGNNWRTGRDNARKLARFLVVAAMVDGYALEPLITDAKTAMAYNKLDKDDQKGVKVFLSTLRTIAGGWAALKQEQRDAFITGSLLYSTLAGDIKKREADEAKREAQEAETERLAALGITPEQAKEAEEREMHANANVAAVERVLALLAQSERTSEENSAMVRLLDAVAAFEAQAVELEQAA